MNGWGSRFIGAVLAVLVGIWGAHLYRRSVDHRVVAVPAGQAGAPEPGDPNPGIHDNFAAGDLGARDPAAGDPAAPYGATGGPRSVVPARLPSFALADLQGRTVPISSWSGRSLIINFWATWCEPCRREIPLLKSLAVEWSDRDLTVVGIAVDHAAKVREFADQFTISYPLLVGEQEALDVAAQFGFDSPAFPFSVFTDRRGEVVALYVGELHRAQADFILSQVQNLNENRVALAEARRAIAAGLAAIPGVPQG